MWNSCHRYQQKLPVSLTLALVLSGSLMAAEPERACVPEGFRALFNGQDLSGWTEDKEPPKHWSVEDEVIVFDGKGSDLLTHEQFRYFTLQVDWKVARNGNSGIYLRGTATQVEINDQDSPERPIWYGTSGGLFPDTPPTQRAAKPTGEWNHYEIRVAPEGITVRLNGKTTVDRYPRRWGENRGGPVGFQDHGYPLWFKNVYIKELIAEIAVEDAGAEMMVKQDFQVERLYAIPSGQGSWVGLCFDDRGRIVATDQNGGLYRVTLRPEISVQPLDVEIGQAHGVLFAFESLYVVVAGDGVSDKPGPGVYRLRDTTGDDQFDLIEQLKAFDGHGEHGPHSLAIAPGGKKLWVICGNGVALPSGVSRNRLAEPWIGELLAKPVRPTQEKNTHPATSTKHAPWGGAQGWMASFAPDGSEWELVGTGVRNAFDLAFNARGELFTYDSDMEYYIGGPGYRPTTIRHVVSGADHGWRDGRATTKDWHPDAYPSVAELGPGSPTGMAFGSGARFPAKYQEALFVCDWSYGRIFAVHLKPHGASYRAEHEAFITGTPLPATDLATGPDGALYFLTGGRGVESSLYRVTYIGSENTELIPSPPVLPAQRVRRRLERYHQVDPQAISVAWPYLKSPDRALRFAARVAIEHQDAESWVSRLEAETDTQMLLTLGIALARVVEDPASLKVVVDRLAAVAWESMVVDQQLELLRLYNLTRQRNALDGRMRTRIMSQLDPVFPSKDDRLNRELAALLLDLYTPHMGSRLLRMLETAPDQVLQQIALEQILRVGPQEWEQEQQQAIGAWFVRLHKEPGRNSEFRKFLANARKKFLNSLSDQERELLTSEARAPLPPLEIERWEVVGRAVVREWTMPELWSWVEHADLTERDSENGRRLFSVALCSNCHRFRGNGNAIGPDLTALVGRFTRRDVLEGIVSPSKVISSQYQMTLFAMKDGRTIQGRVINLYGDVLVVQIDPLDMLRKAEFHGHEVEESKPLKTSLMPPGLLNTLNQEEILDLLAFLLSGPEGRLP